MEDQIWTAKTQSKAPHQFRGNGTFPKLSGKALYSYPREENEQVTTPGWKGIAGELICDVKGGTKVLLTPDKRVIKFNASAGEAANQRYAYDHLDPQIIRVPEVFSFTPNEPQSLQGMLEMEYIEGTIKDSFTSEDIVKLVRVLCYFFGIQNSNPGPLGGGPCEGVMWENYTDFRPSLIADIEDFYNKALQKDSEKLKLKDAPFVLCHLDLMPHNIIWTMDGTIAVIDWQSAGFYPQLLEYSRLLSNSTMRKLLDLIGPTEDERLQMTLIDAAYQRRLLFASSIDHPLPKPRATLRTERKRKLDGQSHKKEDPHPEKKPFQQSKPTNCLQAPVRKK